MARKFVELFNCGNKGVQGLFSSPDPLALGQGQFYALENTRWDKGPIRRRDGVALAEAVLSNPATTLGCTLAMQGQDGATPSMWAVQVVEESGSYRVYYAVYQSGAWVSPSAPWVEATASSGQYGNTRLTAAPVGGPASFSTIPTRYGTYGVVVQNGVDYPLMVQLDTLSAGKSCFIRPVEPPFAAKGARPVARMKDYLNIAAKAAADCTIANTGSGLTAAVAGGAGAYYWTVTASAAAAGATAAIRVNANTIDASDSEQVVLVCSVPSRTWLMSAKWEIQDGSGNLHVVHDPSAFIDGAVEVPVPGSTYTVIAFGLPDTAKVATLAGIKITAQTGLADGVLQVRLVAASGNVPGGAYYAQTLYNTFTKTESPAVVMASGFEVEPAISRSQIINDGSVVPLSSSANVQTIQNQLSVLGTTFKLPLSPLLYYQYDVPIFAPSSTEAGYGVNYVYLYRADAIGDELAFVNRVEATAYVSGSWQTKTASGFASTSSFGGRAIFSDNTPSESRSVTQVAPDAFVTSLPKGLAMVNAGDRMYVAAKDSASGKSDFSTIFVSEKGNPTRFRSVDAFRGDERDTTKGYQISLGDERITAMRATAGSLIGTASVYAWTREGSMYALQDGVALRIGKGGCVGLNAACEINGKIVWVDEDMQVRALEGGQIVHLSRYAVDNFLAAVPSARKGWINTIAYRDRVYIAHAQASNDRNDQVLVWNDTLRAWESLDKPFTSSDTGSPETLMVWRQSGSLRLVFCSKFGSIQEYEKPGQDNDGTVAVTMAVETGAIAEGVGDRVVFGQASVVADKAAGKTLTVRRTQMPQGTNTDGTVDLSDSVDPYVWRVDLASSVPTGIAGYASRIRLSGAVPNGFRLYSFGIMMHDSRTGAESS